MCKRISLIFLGPERPFKGLKNIHKKFIPIFPRNDVFRCVLNYPIRNIMNKVVRRPQKSKKPLF